MAYGVVLIVGGKLAICSIFIPGTARSYFIPGFVEGIIQRITSETKYSLWRWHIYEYFAFLRAYYVCGLMPHTLIIRRL